MSASARDLKRSRTAVSRRSLLALVAVAAACGGSPVGSAGQGGTFDADIAGAAVAQLNGYAGSQGQAGVVWVLQLVDTIVDNHIEISQEGVGRPAGGTTYPLVDATTSLAGAAPANHFVASVTLSQSIMVGPGFDRLTGSMTVTQSTPTSVAGTFTMTASLSTNPASTITVNGTFASVNKGT